MQFSAEAFALVEAGDSRGQFVVFEQGGVKSPLLADESFTTRQKFEMLPRVVPFVLLLIGVMVALYGGFATPSETAGLGALLALLLIAVIYGVWRPKDVAPILSSTLKESTMLMFIIGMSLLFSYVMSYLHISQAAAEWIVGMQLSKWVLLASVLLMVILLGFFLPPVSIILMTAPIILPPLKAAGFDLIWFGVLMTIVMETGLIHPPVGLNIFVIKNIAPDIELSDIIWGVLPFVVLMLASVVLICIFPGIATALPDAVMGIIGAKGCTHLPTCASGTIGHASAALGRVARRASWAPRCAASMSRQTGASIC